MGEILKSSDGNMQLDTTIDEFEHHREEPGSTSDRQNLIDLLYNKGCISLLNKQHIEQQPTQLLQNLEMLHIIQNGSIKTFKVALEFFRETNQDEVFDMLKRKYISEGNRSPNLNKNSINQCIADLTKTLPTCFFWMPRCIATPECCII